MISTWIRPFDSSGARLRLEHDSAWGLAVLYDENVDPEHMDLAETEWQRPLASVQMTEDDARWLHEATGELLAEIADRKSRPRHGGQL